jgi:hypothetical protein
MRVQFGSFDLQSEDRAVVTVRETWEDKRYPGEYPDFGVEPVARRGPYTLQVTYTLERSSDAGGNLAWSVTGRELLEQPPEWEEVNP